MSNEKSSGTGSFEKNLKKLESLVVELESGSLGLDKSLKKFEHGLELYKECKDSLKSAQKKISILTDELNTDDLEEDEYKD